MTPMARYLVGIDLGTTNSALAYIDTRAVKRDGKAGTVPITPFAGTAGIAEFTDRDARERRRRLSKNFWQDG